MKALIKQWIGSYVNDYQGRNDIKTEWKEPLVKFADVGDVMFSQLKEVVSSTHALPEDFLAGARTVITYFLPFAEEVAATNVKGRVSSREWAVAYLETNELIHKLNKYIRNRMVENGYDSSVIPATHNFDEDRLVSDWSHRHAGYIAGLGKFGINNMLITEKGCCGRVGSIVTTARIEPDDREEREYCLYKSEGKCRVCVDRCVNGSLGVDSFDRHSCYEMLLYNDEVHSDLGFTDVCGKCCVGLPCSFTNPVQHASGAVQK